MMKTIKNKEKEHDKKEIKIDFYILASFAFFVMDLVLLCLYFKMGQNPHKPKPYFILPAIFGFGIMIPLFLWIRSENVKINDVYSKYEEYLRGKLKNGKSNEAKEIRNNVSLSVKNKDIINDMIKNNAEIIEYFKITKAQERTSYCISIACAIIGIGILVYSVYAIFNNESTDETIISVISGAITELVSGIVLWIHNKSAMQLNYYYDALHENEKFLSAISLANKLENTKREQMYMEIIRAQIKAKNDKEE